MDANLGRGELWRVIVAVTTIVYDDDGDAVLFLERKKPPLNWCLPGGKVAMGEDLEFAARRELLEETGLRVGSLIPIDSWQGKNPGRHGDIPILSINYLCRTSSREVVLSPGEHGDFRWVALGDFDDFRPQTDFDLNKIALLIRRYAGTGIF
jgi:8-oxo-dGTP diphosphatase